MKSQREYWQEGERAFHEGLDATDCPYEYWKSGGRDWLHGWWGQYYRQRDKDQAKIAEWLLDNVRNIVTKEQADGIALFIVTLGHYDRNLPIPDNRLSGVEFTIPAPATL